MVSLSDDIGGFFVIFGAVGSYRFIIFEIKGFSGRFIFCEQEIIRFLISIDLLVVWVGDEIVFRHFFELERLTFFKIRCFVIFCGELVFIFVFKATTTHGQQRKNQGHDQTNADQNEFFIAEQGFNQVLFRCRWRRCDRSRLSNRLCHRRFNGSDRCAFLNGGISVCRFSGFTGNRCGKVAFCFDGCGFSVSGIGGGGVFARRLCCQGFIHLGFQDFSTGTLHIRQLIILQADQAFQFLELPFQQLQTFRQFRIFTTAFVQILKCDGQITFESGFTAPSDFGQTATAGCIRGAIGGQQPDLTITARTPGLSVISGLICGIQLSGSCRPLLVLAFNFCCGNLIVNRADFARCRNIQHHVRFQLVDVAVHECRRVGLLNRNHHLMWSDAGAR